MKNSNGFPNTNIVSLSGHRRRLSLGSAVCGGHHHLQYLHIEVVFVWAALKAYFAAIDRAALMAARVEVTSKGEHHV